MDAAWGARRTNHFTESNRHGRTRRAAGGRFRWYTPMTKRGKHPMWQYQKLSMLLALGMVAISSSTGCATSVEDPAVDEEAMSADETAESSEALTAGGWGRGGYVGYGGYGYGRGFRRGFYGGYGYGGYGYGGYGYGAYGDWGRDQNVGIVINNGPGYGDYGDYGDFDDFEDCGDDGFLDDGWN